MLSILNADGFEYPVSKEKNPLAEKKRSQDLGTEEF